jgi:hypothetical protein
MKKKNEVQSVKRKQKAITLYLEDVYIGEIEKASNKRKKEGRSSGNSAILRELVVYAIQKGMLND